jgi:hypothetical protein
MKLHYLLAILQILAAANIALAQRTCGSSDYYQSLTKQYPELAARAKPYPLIQSKAPVGVINVPVVVHIVYNTEQQNLPQKDIQTQIDVLNRDFQGSNSDVIGVPAAFKNLIAGDCEINFYLKNVTRTKTNVPVFKIDLKLDRNGKYILTPGKQPIKFTNLGGIDASPSTECLNIWVGNILDANSPSSGLLGFSTFPGSPNDYDGVVIQYSAFGTIHADSPYNKGRTTTHEVGHWLNLRHIWGDKYCGDDYVDDTPTQETWNGGTPIFPIVNCDNAPNGAMFMNYMDYVDDNSMFMFTQGQKNRMRDIFGPGGYRSAFFNGVASDSARFRDYQESSSAPIITKVIQSRNLAVIRWQPSKNASKYHISIKEVKDTTWNTMETKEPQIKFAALIPQGLYEVRVAAIVNDHKIESIPYTFIAYSAYFHTPTTQIQKVP